jgi:hypothetical protein
MAVYLIFDLKFFHLYSLLRLVNLFYCLWSYAYFFKLFFFVFVARRKLKIGALSFVTLWFKRRLFLKDFCLINCTSLDNINFLRLLIRCLLYSLVRVYDYYWRYVYYLLLPFLKINSSFIFTKRVIFYNFHWMSSNFIWYFKTS